MQSLPEWLNGLAGDFFNGTTLVAFRETITTIIIAFEPSETRLVRLKISIKMLYNERFNLKGDVVFRIPGIP